MFDRPDVSNIKLPEYVIVCGVCKGTGRHEQTYNAGCGAGLYRSNGPCTLCGQKQMYVGWGFIYAWYKPISSSVLAQIETMNPEIDFGKWEVC